jgi:predicted DNA binding CopG/RHH family protein
MKRLCDKVIVRVQSSEKERLKNEAKKKGIRYSVYLRMLLNPLKIGV